MRDPTETEKLIKSVKIDETEGWSENRRRASRRWITIEPVIFSCLIAYGTIQTLRTEYVRVLTSQEFGANDTEANMTCFVNTTSPEYKLEEKVQSETSLRVMYLTMCSAGLNIFSAPLLSTLSDQAGRKMALFLCCFGIFANSCVYLVVSGFHQPFYYLFVGEVLQGLTGSLTLMVAVSLAYIADVTTKQQRMFRFVIIDTTLFFAIAVAQVAMGYVVSAYGFVPPFAAMSIACGVSMLYIVAPKMLIETRVKQSYGSSIRQVSELFGSLVQLMQVKEGARHIRIGLLILIGFFMTLMFQGAVATSILLGMGSPICWSVVTVGIFTAVTLFVGCLGLLIAGMTLPRILREYWIVYLSCLSSIGCYVLTGFAKTSLFMFIASFIGCIRNLPGPIIRTMLSKAVTEDEQGCVFAMIGVIESLASFGSPLMLGAFYAATVHIYPGLVFFMLAGINIIPIGLTMMLHGMLVRMGKADSKDGVPKPIQVQVESFAQDTDHTD